MRDQIEAMLISIKKLRSQAFSDGNEELHNQLGRALSNLIRAKEVLK